MMGNGAWLLIVLLVITFLLGSIPWGVIVSKVFFKKDLRQEGSGNIGATNAMRSLGKKGGAAVFVLDFVKGLAAGFVGLAIASVLAQPDAAAGGAPAAASWLMVLAPADAPDAQAWAVEAISAGYLRQMCLGIAFFGCIWGHIFSPWLGFKGGKGITVAVGCMFVTYGPIVAIVELAVFAILVASTKYVSVGSIVAAAAAPFIALWLFWGNWPCIVACSIAAATVVWAHRGNIKRLMTHTESRIGSKGKTAGANGEG